MLDNPPCLSFPRAGIAGIHYYAQLLSVGSSWWHLGYIFLVCAFQHFSRPLIQTLLGFHETEGLCSGYCPDGAIPQSLEPLSYRHLLIPHARR